jgi:cell wall-associated NlpC family hydrolase
MACVCRAVVSLHRRPDTDSEIVTQEIFGHPVHACSTRKGFVHCTLRDGYGGWVAAGGLAIGGDYKATHLVRKRFAWVRARGGSPLMLPMGGLLKVASAGKVRHAVELPDGRRGTVSAGSLESVALWNPGLSGLPRLLREMLGTPYLWGGKSTFGFDCSGLVQFVFGLLGTDLPRDSRDQARKGLLINELEGVRPFDLVFFGSGGGIDHVAIYLGDSMIAHASGYVRVEALDPSSYRFRADLYDKFRFARRIVNIEV